MTNPTTDNKKDGEHVLHILMYDPWRPDDHDEEDSWPREARFSVIVVRTAVRITSPSCMVIIDISAGFACTGFADLMAEELRPTARTPHYPRPRPFIVEEGGRG